MKEKATQYAIIILISILGGMISGWMVFKDPKFSPIQVINKEDKIYIQENSALEAMIKDVKDSVAGVQSNYLDNSVNGSGFILTDDGLIVTLAENIPLNSKSDIYIKGEENVSYQVLKRDLVNNLALIKSNKNNLSTRGFLDSEIILGMRIFIVSQSYDYSSGKFFASINEGIIKSINEEKIKTNIFEINRVEGSPVFNIEGKVVGLAYKDVNNFVSIIPISKIKEFAGI
ncbi:MAG: serine protease [Candidatus Pacebacteria bacterium]|nr:serine protease [Candidatus Paceibacterota bacterium]